VASGHGIGKSAIVGMIIDWGLSTCVDARIVITANTQPQLRTKTVPEVSTWLRRSISASYFDSQATSVRSRDKGHDETWRADFIPWSEQRPEAFAGLHNKGKRVIVIFDEASAIPPPIWEVVEGALTDEGTEIIFIAFGNPTRNTGKFFECFGSRRNRWRTAQIDSRDVEGTNKEQLNQWVEDYGEDSDFVRVRVRGIFPRASSTQYISRDLVDEAMRRQPDHTRYSRACVGVDVARFGDDSSAIATRIGRDARKYTIRQFRGLDTMRLASIIAEHVTMLRDKEGVDVTVFIDSGGGWGVIDRLRQIGVPVIEIAFGGTADDPTKYRNKRAEMWGRVKEWLTGGCIEKDEVLATDLTGIEYGYTDKGQVALEKKEDMKKRGLSSPDKGDALALTFAYPIAEFEGHEAVITNYRKYRDYDPYAVVTK
jgi:hypothetical protein